MAFNVYIQYKEKLTSAFNQKDKQALGKFVCSGMNVAKGTGNLQVSIATGFFFLDGCLVEMTAAQNDILSLAAGSTNPRIDLIVVNFTRVGDSGGTQADPTFQIVQGTPSANPVEPSLTENQLRLASVAVGANVTSISNGNITNSPDSKDRVPELVRFGITLINNLRASELLPGSFTLIDSGLEANIPSKPGPLLYVATNSGRVLWWNGSAYVNFADFTGAATPTSTPIHGIADPAFHSGNLPLNSDTGPHVSGHDLAAHEALGIGTRPQYGAGIKGTVVATDPVGPIWIMLFSAATLLKFAAHLVTLPVSGQIDVKIYKSTNDGVSWTLLDTISYTSASNHTYIDTPVGQTGVSGDLIKVTVEGAGSGAADLTIQSEWKVTTL